MDRKSLLEQKRAKLQELKRQRALREKEFRDENSQSLESTNTYVDNIVEEVLGPHKDKNKDENKENLGSCDNEQNEHHDKGLSTDLSDSSGNNGVMASVISEIQSCTSEGEGKACDPSLKVKIPMFTKAIDAENNEHQTSDFTDEPTDEYFKQEKSDMKSKMYQKLKHSIELELQKKYEQELEERLKQMMKDQESQINEANTNILEALQVPRDPLARNVERESRYATPISANCSVGELNNDKFTIDVPHYISKTFILDANLKARRALCFLDWSSFHHNIFLACYSFPESTPIFPRSVLIVWDVDAKKPVFTFLSYVTLTVAKFSTAKSNVIYAGGEDGKIYLWKLNSYSRYPVASSQQNAGNAKNIAAVVALYETVNSVYCVLSNGSLLVYSLDLLSELSEETLGIQLKQDIFITACYADATTVIAGLATGYIYMKRLGKDTKSTLIYSPEKSHRAHLSIPVMSITYCNGVILAGFFNHKVIILEPGASKKIVRVPYPVSDAKFKTTIGDGSSFPNDSLLTSKNEFASLSCSNQIDFWNILKHELDPIVQMKIKGDETLNKMAWSKDGKTVICGGLTGKVYLIELAEDDADAKDSK